MHKAISRYVRAEKSAGYRRDEHAQMLYAQHVRRACALYGWNRNPY
jgi:hypothetical protein